MDEVKIKCTYHGGRTCKYCFELICDQAHALQKFCSREVMDDGSVKCCKDDFHAAGRKIRMEPYKNIAKHHEKMRNQIKQLKDEVGDIVNLELIDRAGIILQRPVEIKFIENDCQEYFFVEFQITKIQDNQYKITKHGRIF